MRISFLATCNCCLSLLFVHLWEEPHSHLLYSPPWVGGDSSHILSLVFSRLKRCSAPAIPYNSPTPHPSTHGSISPKKELSASHGTSWVLNGGQESLPLLRWWPSCDAAPPAGSPLPSGPFLKSCFPDGPPTVCPVAVWQMSCHPQTSGGSSILSRAHLTCYLFFFFFLC